MVGCFDFLLRDPAPNTKQDETPAIKRSAPPPAAAAAMVVVSKPGEGVCSGAVGVVVGGWGEGYVHLWGGNCQLICCAAGTGCVHY